MNVNVIKQHLFEVVCGLVIVAALSTYFLWTSWDSNTKDAAGVRDGKVTSVNNINRDKTPMPGLDATKRENVIVGPLPGDSADPRVKKVGSAVELRKQIFDSLNNSARQIADSETRGNSQNKMTRGSPALPVFDPKNPTSMMWEPQPYLLPRTFTTGGNRQDPHLWQQTYSAAFDGFVNYLKGGLPPTQKQVEDAYDREQTASQPRAGRPALVAGPSGQRDPAKFREFSKKFVMDWDSQWRIYASRDSFQIQPWVTGNELEEPHLFQGFIDTWIQADIVTAIGHVNGTTHNVLSTPIKRIEQISIGATAEAQTVIGTALFSANQPSGLPAGGAGSGAASGGGPLFISMTGAGAAGPADPNTGVAAAPAIDGYKKSMTGRAVSDLFDVTHVRVVLHMNPGVINQFLSELYKQSNSYTLINVNMQAVDPLEAAANGYLYGPMPMMRVELVLEAVFYRSWLEPLMPDMSIRSSIGLKPVGGPGGGGPGGVGQPGALPNGRPPRPGN